MLQWHFKKLDPDYPDDSALAERNFRRESTELPAIFVRELIQNVLDARQKNLNGPARIEIKIIEETDSPTASYLNSILAPLDSHLTASDHSSVRNITPAKFMVIEEFGTIGLTGDVRNSRARGEGERWANFWHGEGKRSKGGKSLGRAGQGKITYHMASGARALFAFSVRENATPSACIFGKCIVSKTHQINDQHYMRHGYWCRIDEALPRQPQPAVDDLSISEFCNLFHLRRKPDELGTSWVIPYPNSVLNQQSLVAGVLKDFHFTILKGALEVQICGEEISKANVVELIPKFIKQEDISKEFLLFLKNSIDLKIFAQAKSDWSGIDDSLDDSAFAEKDLSKIKNEFESGRIISVRFPVSIEKIDGTKLDSHFDVYLQRPEIINRTEELYIRSDLIIGDEKWLKSLPGKAFGLVLAEDNPLSELLGYAEEASHLKWNAAEEDLAKYYKTGSAKEVLSRVRRSLPRLYRFLSGHAAGIDENALLSILSIPNIDNNKAKVRRIRPKPNPVPPRIEPERKVRPFNIHDIANGVAIGSTDASGIAGRRIKALFAYEQVVGEGDPFASYHPFDFDLEGGAIEIRYSGVRLIDGVENRLIFEVFEPRFEVKLVGFDTTKRLRCKAILLPIIENSEAEED